MQIYIYTNGTTKHNLIGDILDNGTPLFSGGEDAELPIADSSYRFCEIMGDDNVVLNFSLPVFFEFPIGCRINVDFTEYTLVELGNVTKQNERWYDYTITFESPQKTLSRYKFRNHVDGRLNFTLTAQPQEFLDHICRNMNMRDGGNEWTVGDCIISSEKTQSFSHNTVLDALNAVAQLFETEWEIVNKRISLRKIEYNKTNPISLSYGKGNGFKSGISRQLSGEKAVDVLWVDGGDRNIDSQTYTYTKDGQTYHANKLRLPRSASFVYVPSDGEPDLSGQISRGIIFTSAEWSALTPEEKATYPDNMPVTTDADGFGVSRTNRINNGYEESLEATDIYPKKVLTITAVTNSDPEKHFWEIKASDNNVDYNDCLTPEQATLIFQDGMLGGKEFNWSKYNHTTKQFDIVPQEIDSIIMPDEDSGYYPQIGNTFAVFHISLPSTYIEEAEMDMLLTACEFLYKHGEVEVEFQGTVDGIWAKTDWELKKQYFRLGGYILFTDNAFCQDGKKMRILSIKQYINNPHAPEVTLSNSSVSQGVTSEIKKIPQNQVALMAEIEQNVQYTKRTFAAAQDTSAMIEKLLEEYPDAFTAGVKPITVQTMQLLVGNPDLQYSFGTATTTPQSGKQKVTNFTAFTYTPSYSNHVLHLQQVDIEHHTYASDYGSTSVAGQSATYCYWHIAAADLSPADSSKSYYVYITAPKTAFAKDNNGNYINVGYLISGADFYLSETPKSHTNSYFYLLYGILNGEDADGNRSFASLNGFTEINGNQVTTERIVSADGGTYIDLVTGVISSNKPIKFKYGSTENTDLSTIIGTVDTNATTAKNTANTANSNASTAVSTANTANTNASAAVSTANTANSNASAAVSTANTANTNATTAVNNAALATQTANAASAKAEAVETATAAVRNAMSGTTEVTGGLMLTNAIFLKNNSNVVNAGVSGLNQSTVGKNPRFWAGGTWTDAVEAAQQSAYDIPSRTVPILLTDNGVNSNIGIFKVLSDAISVMRLGQVVRISTNALDSEFTNYSPVEPFTISFSTQTQYDTGSSSSIYAATIYNYGTVRTYSNSKTLTLTGSIYVVSRFVGSVTNPSSPRLQGLIEVVVEAVADGNAILIGSGTISSTIDVYQDFNFTATGLVPISKTFNCKTFSIRVRFTSKRLSLISGSMTGYTFSYGSSTAYCYNSVRADGNSGSTSISASESKSCYIIAKGGFACAQSSTQMMKYDAINNAFVFNGGSYKLNGEDYVTTKSETVTLGSGYLELRRRGNLVTMKLTIPQAYVGNTSHIPSGYRPIIPIDCILAVGNDRGNVYLATISADGKITCPSMPTSTTGYGHATYLTKDSYPT